MANDAEIKLHFTAEYKQALIAIANMDKALKVLQQHANLIFNAGGASPLNFNNVDIQKFKDALTQAAQAISGVSAELVNFGKTWQAHGVNKQQVQDVADLAQNYLNLAAAINGVIAGMNNLSGANAGNTPQIQALQQQIQLLQSQLTQLQQQIQQVQQQQQQTPPGPGNPNPGINNNVRTMTWLQQAQAARRLSRAIQELGEQFSSLAEDAKNGNLNLTDMVSKLIMLSYYMKGTMGRAGALLMVIESLQNIWNTYARSARRAADAEVYIQDTLRISKQAYEDAAAAKDNYLKQEARNNELSVLKTQYKELNDEIERGVGLIELTINSEIARLALTEDEAAHTDTMRKAELGRRLTRGEISQQEYESALVELNKESKIRKAQATITRAELKQRGTQEKLDKERVSFAEKERLANEKEALLKGYMSEEEIEALQKGRESLEGRRNDKQAQFFEAQKRLQSMTDSNFIVNALKGAVTLGKYPLEVAEQYNEFKALQAELQNAERALLDYETFIEEKAGTDNLQEYQARRKQAQEQFNIAASERNAAGGKIDAAAKANDEAQRALDEARAASTQEVKQARALAESELATLRDKAEAQKKKAELDEQYRKIQKDIETMTNRQVQAAKKELAEALAQSGLNHHTRAHLERLNALYSGTLQARKEEGQQTIQEVRELASEGKSNKIVRWAERNVETYATTPLTGKQAANLIEQGTQALRTSGTHDDAVISAIMEQAKFSASVTARQQKNIETLQRELAKNRRQQEAMLRHNL